MKTLETTPPGETHWSTRAMAKAAGISHRWSAASGGPFGCNRTAPILQAVARPAARREDPRCRGALHDSAGNAVVFSVDEKSQIQALQRAQPILPMDLGQPERRTHNYIRHGTLDLFAALNVATGEVVTRCTAQHRAEDFVAFLRDLDARVEPDLDIHVVLDNLSAHRAPPVQRWFLRHPRVQFHFTPTYASWLNLVERFFGLLTRESAQAWIPHQRSAIAGGHPGLRRRSQRARTPFTWAKTADEILDKIRRFGLRSNRCTGNDTLLLKITDPGD